MRVIIAGGGTGGHLFPGIAVAEELARAPDVDILFVGSTRGLETRIVPAAGFALETVDVSGLVAVGAGGMARGLGRLPAALAGSMRILGRFRPDVVLGVGGYASGPLVLGAALRRIPTAIQEQNSVPGFTNRVLGRFVRAVFTAFEDAGRFFAAAKVSLIGNPVRRAFVERAAGDPPVGPVPQVPATAREPRLLAVGGSGGARAVNDLVLGAGEILHRRGQLPAVVHQTGAADFERCRERARALGLGDRLETLAFIDDMASAYRDADLVVGRAGALTLAELAITGRPAILVPLPVAAADHQSRNADAFVRAGAALSFAERTTTPDILADAVVALMTDAPRRARMAAAMATFARPAAARDIADRLAQLAGTGPAWPRS